MLTSADIQASIQAAGSDMTGPDWVSLSAAISLGVTNWAHIPSNVVVFGTAAGSAGAGSVFGKLTVAPNPAPVLTALGAAGLVGVRTGNIARAVGVGVANAWTASAQYSGVCSGVGVGTDVVVRVEANPVTLTEALMVACQGLDLRGVQVPTLMSALAVGVASLIRQYTTGTGTVTGAGGPSPSTGVSVSRVL